MLVNNIFDTKKLKDISRSLSFYLRHNPQDINIILDTEGYTDTSILLSRLDISIDELDWIVENNSKKRFSYNNDKSGIRANQGHSLDSVKLTLEKTNCDILYHGTSSEYVDDILSHGLKKMNRNHVHLSDNIETARNVGKRKLTKNNVLTILQIDTTNIDISISENGVYLADFIPPSNITIYQCQHGEQ